MIIKILTILLLLCILSYLVTNRKKPFLFLKTLFMGVVFIFIGYISLAISAVIIYGIIQFITIDFGSFSNGYYINLDFKYIPIIYS